MSDERTIELLRSRAEACLDRNDTQGAVDLIEQALAIDADIADLHASLSLCLVDLKLVEVARAEADIAMALDPSEAICHTAMGQVLYAEGKRREALRSLEAAVGLEPEDTFAYVLMAQVKRSLGEDCEDELAAALEIDPEDPSVLAAYAEFEFFRGNLDEAERYAREALEHDAGYTDALLTMGWILLRRGDLEGARAHASIALREDPRDEAALRLLAAYKARKSPVLGLWFRWNLYMSTLSEGKSIVVLLAMYVVYRLLILILGDLDLGDVAQIVTYAWLAFVAYTWFGPVLFDRMLSREVDSIHLDPEY
jgi:Tfp pilus assembly protein PilF